MKDLVGDLGQLVVIWAKVPWVDQDQTAGLDFAIFDVVEGSHQVLLNAAALLAGREEAARLVVVAGGSGVVDVDRDQGVLHVVVAILATPGLPAGDVAVGFAGDDRSSVAAEDAHNHAGDASAAAVES